MYSTTSLQTNQSVISCLILLHLYQYIYIYCETSKFMPSFSIHLLAEDTTSTAYATDTLNELNLSKHVKPPFSNGYRTFAVYPTTNSSNLLAHLIEAEATPLTTLVYPRHSLQRVFPIQHSPKPMHLSTKGD